MCLQLLPVFDIGKVLTRTETFKKSCLNYEFGNQLLKYALACSIKSATTFSVISCPSSLRMPLLYSNDVCGIILTSTYCHSSSWLH